MDDENDEIGRFGLDPGEKKTKPGGRMRPGTVETRWGFFRTTQGWCAAAWTARGLFCLVLPRKKKASALRVLKIQSRMAEIALGKTASPVPKNIAKQTQDALRGNPYKYDKIDLSALTPFQKKILLATRRIPWGKTQTYGWISRHSGSPASYRATGQALNRNPIPLFIPCHRVIGSENKLGGFGSGIDWKIRLLEAEGLKIIRCREGSYRVQKL